MASKNKDLFASMEQSAHDMEKLRKAFLQTATTARKVNNTMTSPTHGYTNFGPTTTNQLSNQLIGGGTAYFPTVWSPFCAFCLVREDDNAIIPQAATQIDGTALCRQCARQVLNIIEEED